MSSAQIDPIKFKFFSFKTVEKVGVFLFLLPCIFFYDIRILLYIKINHISKLTGVQILVLISCVLSVGTGTDQLLHSLSEIYSTFIETYPEPTQSVRFLSISGLLYTYAHPFKKESLM